MSHVLAPKRLWILLVPMCLHGLAMTVGAIVWFVLALSSIVDPTASARHLLRAPTVAETAGGRTWFTATSEDLVAIDPPDGGEPAWLPETAPAGLQGTNDPWAGCSVRKQHYSTGKNAAWHDDTAWSYGGYVLHDPHGKRVVVPLSFLASSQRVEITLEEVERLVANQSQPPNTRYLRECFPKSASVAVDGFVDENGNLVRGVNEANGDTGARIGTPADTAARARRGIAFECVGLAAGLVPFAWLSAWVAFFRRPFALRTAAVTMLPKSTPAILRGVGALLLVLATIGIAAVASGRVAPVILLASVLAGSVVSFWNVFLRTAAGTLVHFRDALVGASATWKSAEGKMVAPEVLATGRVTKRAHPFVRVETFAITPKGAVGTRVTKEVSHPRIELSLGDDRAFVETETLELFGPSEEVRLAGSDLAALGLVGTFDPASTYLVRETVLDEGAPVSVVGESTTEADPLARGEDYREAGRSAVFVAKEGKGPLVFAHARAALLGQANKDLTTLSVLRIVAAGLFAALAAAPVLAAILGR